MARLRVIYNAREVIAAHQAVTGEDHYTYIYYYAFSSALEEVIEELELLAILIKPLVGVTLVSSSNCLAFGGPGDQLQLGPAMATSQLGLPPLPTSAQEGSGLSAEYRGNISGDAASFPRAPSTMVNIGSSTAGMGIGAAGSQLQYPQDLMYRQQGVLEQEQAQHQQQQRLQMQLQAQQKQILQLQLQLFQQQQLGQIANPELDLPMPTRILINPQIATATTTNLENANATLVSRVNPSTGDSSGSSHRGPRRNRKESRRSRVKVKTSNHQTEVLPAAPSSPSCVKTLAVDGTNARIANAATMPTSPILMDESLLGNRHVQRYKEALQVAQEASGQQVIEMSPPVAAVPTQIQIAKGATSSGSSSSKPHNTGVQGAKKQSKRPSAKAASPFNAVELETLDGNRRPSLVTSSSDNSVNNDANIHQHQHHQQMSHMHQGDVSTLAAATSTALPSTPAATAVVVTPFGSDMIPEAPLPLHLVPMQTQQTQAHAQGNDIPGKASHYQHSHHQSQHSS
ncbi:hypothetical protein EDD21DRAFT_207574 [Dissophora ornata]|nr:hypothetical protein EDD21DRAFT_207574 [Dissophora ornata]